MCGIFGQINRADNTILGIKDFLNHRGPDAYGCWNNDKVSLEHTRLSILDLRPEANQPFMPVSDYIMVYNGEIYNFRELRESLKRDFNFRTTSDTEVLYYGFLKKGPDILNSLNGMFAFAFYDRKSGVIYIARDRYGIKPVFYYADKDRFIFSSEQKAIYRSIRPQINYNRLNEYFAYKFVADNETLVKNVYELPPGHLIRYKVAKGEYALSKWYELPAERSNDTANLAEKIEELLISSVKMRMLSDVPVGIQLSGGVDSSVISKISCEYTKYPLNSYSISFPGSPFDEKEHANRISKKLGTKHHPIDFTIDDFVELWQEAAFHNDEPLNHPHSLPIHKLTKEARRDVTVLLSGEGADEIFLGYEQYIKKLNFTKDKDIADFSLFNDDVSVKNILVPELISEKNKYGGRFDMLESDGVNSNRITDFELKTHLLSLLNRIDKMSMINSVEIRTPFLDYRLVETGVTEKESNLLKGSKRKIPLSSIYDKYYKDGLSGRPKVGFRVPYDEWLSGNKRFRDMVRCYIEGLKGEEYLRKDYIERLTDRLGKNITDNRTFRQSWVLANYALWKKVFNI